MSVQEEIRIGYRDLDRKLFRMMIESERESLKCPHVPPCFENSDGCWNYDEAKKRVNAYPNFP